MQKTYIVYRITNIVDGKCYIGQTVYSHKRRLSQHKFRARHGVYTENPLYKAMIEFGEDNFISDVIEAQISSDRIDSREKYWIQKEDTMFPHGYNVQSGGKEAFEYSKELLNGIEERRVNRSPHGDIVMLDKRTYEEIAIFRCSAHAERFLKEHGYPKASHWSITRCCMGKQGIAYGHKWKFRDHVCGVEQRTLSGDSDLR